MTHQPYHHGELRAALLDAALAALREAPDRPLSIRSLAAGLGVSPTAPHAHFKTKGDLLAALAVQGFQELREATAGAASRPRAPRAKIEAIAEAYLRFSAENPGLYRLMFTTGVTSDQHPELFAASRAAYAVLREAIQEAAPAIRPAELDRRALAGWSVVHGLAALSSEGRLPEDVLRDRSVRSLARVAAGAVLGDAG